MLLFFSQHYSTKFIRIYVILKRNCGLNHFLVKPIKHICNLARGLRACDLSLKLLWEKEIPTIKYFLFFQLQFFNQMNFSVLK